MSRGKASAEKSADKKKPARVAEGPEAPGFARSMGENTGRIIRPLIPLSMFIAAFAVISMLLWRPVHGDAGTKGGAASRSRLTARAIRQAVLLKPKPEWISKEDFEQVADLGLIAANRSIFESSLSHALAERYAMSVWVERVQVVRLRFPAQLEVEIDWRKPAARINQSSMVLDRNGVVLNLMSDSPAVRDVPRISGIICARTEAGRKVPEKDLLDAIELLGVAREALASSPGSLKVADIQREPSGMWRIVTDRGPLVYWGAFTDDPPMDEPRTREKADLLRRRLCESKDPTTLEYIKVYHASAPFKPRGVAEPAPAPASGVRQRRRD
jgi:hypothetical protein